jgi:hypothetical protein
MKCKVRTEKATQTLRVAINPNSIAIVCILWGVFLRRNDAMRKLSQGQGQGLID